MLNVEHIFLSFSSQTIFNDVSFHINKKEKLALIGKNGAGKTTLLRILSGEILPDKGKITKQNNLTIGFLPQIILQPPNRTLKEEITQTAKTEITPLFLAQMDKILIGLGFDRHDLEKNCATFSGGWTMRIELAKMLLQNPDLLLLDEPTNHLDIESIQWLENYIGKNPTALVLISHDKDFLNNVTTRTIELNLGHIYDYKVPYNQFVELRKQRKEQQIRTFINQQKIIKETESFIDKFRYKATKATQVQARIKQLSKLEIVSIDEDDPSKLNIRFQPTTRSGDFPLIINNLQKKYNDHIILSNVNLTVKRGEKIAFVGKNGEGKSTLVKCIMKQTEFNGEIKIGHNVQIGYFAQNQAATLNENLTVLQTIDNVAKGDIRTQIRNILGAFMFSGNDIDKKVKVLSGGERTRLALIKLLLEPYNLLILDEPTNHLDIPSKDRLKKALLEFDGTVICVSHDRNFLNGLVNKIYEFSNKKVLEHTGNIYDFLKNKQTLNPIEHTPTPPSNTNSKPQKSNPNSTNKINYEEQKKRSATERKKDKQIQQIENEIEELEKQQKHYETLLQSTTNQTPENLQAYQDTTNKLNAKMKQWENILLTNP